MANLNQSTVSAKAFRPQASDSALSVSSHQRRKAVWPRTALMMAAWFEILVGASFILVLDGQSQFLFGTTPEGVGVYFGRFAGIALIGLGLACIPANLEGTHRRAVQGLLIFNIGVTIFFAWIAVATTFRGVILWPVVIMHAVISIALALSLRHKGF
jgi:hypothetical protein